MSRHLISSIALLVAAIAASPALTAGQARTATEGVYTAAQATRGQAAFKEKCAVCHGDMLEGLVGPPLTGDEFFKSWGNQPLSELVDKIQKTMPQNDPGSLMRPEIVDLVAHILLTGKFPVGTAQLPAADEALKQIVLAPGA